MSSLSRIALTLMEQRFMDNSLGHLEMPRRGHFRGRKSLVAARVVSLSPNTLSFTTNNSSRVTIINNTRPRFLATTLYIHFL